MRNLQETQAEILELVARGHALGEVATRLCQRVEEADRTVLCSVILVDEERRLRPLAAPSLPESFSRFVDGIVIGPKVGSCGTAAYRGEEVLVEDIATDPLWEGISEPALALGLTACWSRPILARDGRVLGTFAFYYRERRGPSPEHRAVIEGCVHVCAIAIEHEMLVRHNRRIALKDRLTGLPNRTAFEEDLAVLPKRGPCPVGLLLVDVDGLKVANDTLGHAAGDALIAGVAAVLSGLGEGTRAYRIGGDEFAVLRPADATAQTLRSLALTIFRRLRALPHEESSFGWPRVTIGAALGPDVAALRRDADLALYHAKSRRRGTYLLFKEGMRTAIGSRLEAIHEVEAALAEDRMLTWFQPVVRLEDGRIVGMEALARMRRPSGEVIPAGAFHQALDDPAISSRLTDATLLRVTAAIRGWLDAGIPVGYVGVNVTAFDLARGNLDRRLLRACERHRVAPSHLVLEVTENAVVRVGDRSVTRTLSALKTHGVRIALDDFGTGYASLTHLLELPVDVIKIDKRFIARMASDPRARVIVDSMLSVARGLSLRVVAEGIERADQAADLRAMGCQLGQGFLFDAARPPEVAGALLRRFGVSAGVPADGDAARAGLLLRAG